MTLTILASVSLLALVSSARPLPKPEEQWKGLQLSESGEPTNVQHAIQAVVKSHASFDEDLEDEVDVQVHLASIEEVQAYLSSAEDDAVKALIPLNEDELHSPDEKELYEILNRLESERGRGTPVPDDALDTMSLASPSSVSSVAELPVEEAEVETEIPTPVIQPENSVSKPVVVIVGSCVISFLALCCVAASLYIVEMLRKSVLQSPAAWDILPQIEKSAVERSGQSNDVSHVSREPVQDSEKAPMPGALTINTRLLRIPSHTSLRESMSEKMSLDSIDPGDDLNEKFFDVESSDDDSPYTTPSVTPVDLPSDLSTPSPAGTAPANDSPLIYPPEMSEASATAWPSWSVRATEAKQRTVETTSSVGSRAVVPGGAREGQRRAFYAMPELDAALAMQLRPGLGLGADAAWLVRFVMALFGWCAVLMSGGARRQ
ncbi:hypothetical protein DFH11DRAFT_489549 [Phellopilus nigrolimitatus]|nr:hypothetical protein DFH11DRAFT_489549 [Phellopilus nigrolimitatus]